MQHIILQGFVAMTLCYSLCYEGICLLNNGSYGKEKKDSVIIATIAKMMKYLMINMNLLHLSCD